MSTGTFLTFNRNLKEHVSLSSIEAVTYEEAAQQILPLKYKWIVWEQIVPTPDKVEYSNFTKDIAGFESVQEFWQLWNSLPQPSELLSNKRMVRDSTASEPVDAIMIFKDGVKPLWEDPLNTIGGHFEFKFRPNAIAAAQVDEYWNNLVLGLIGQTIEPAEMITGVRLVDKLCGGRQPPCIRFEVWFTDISNAEGRDQLKNHLENCMAQKLDGMLGARPNGELKTHKTK